MGQLLTVFKLVQSANFGDGDKSANGPHTNFSLQSSILLNINFSWNSSARKTLQWSVKFLWNCVTYFSSDIIVCFLIRQLPSILIQSLDEQIGSRWRRVEFERKWVTPAAARKLFQYASHKCSKNPTKLCLTVLWHSWIGRQVWFEITTCPRMENSRRKLIKI